MVLYTNIDSREACMHCKMDPCRCRKTSEGSKRLAGDNSREACARCKRDPCQCGKRTQESDKLRNYCFRCKSNPCRCPKQSQEALHATGTDFGAIDPRPEMDD
jgi:hypothetical protein